MPIYGYARVSTDGQTLETQLSQLRAAGAEKFFREKVSGARADRVQLRKAIAAQDPKLAESGPAAFDIRVAKAAIQRVWRKVLT